MPDPAAGGGYRGGGSASVRFAIIIPTYNRAWLLPRAIRSVLAQDYTNWGLYVVDDGSDDDTEFVVSSFLADPRVCYIRNPVNSGYRHARNVGLARVESDGADWFAWIDDDDQLVEGALTTVRREIEKYPGFRMFVFSSLDVEGKSLGRVETSGPGNYLREWTLKPAAGDMHEFVMVSCLNGARLNVSPREPENRFWAKLSLRAGGVVFCNTPTRIKQFMDDGLAAKRRGRSKEKRMEHQVAIHSFLVRDWLRVIWRHPRSLAVYQVWMQSVRKSAVNWLRLLKRKVCRKLRLRPRGRGEA